MIFAAGFLLTLGMFFLFTNTLMEQKNFGIQTTEVLSSLKLVEVETQNLLVKRGDLTELQDRWLVSITQFQKGMEDLTLEISTSDFPEEQARQLKRLLGLWKEIYEYYYLPAMEHLLSLIDANVEEIIEGRGILFTMQTLLSPAEEGEFLSTVAENRPRGMTRREVSGQLLTMYNYTRRFGEEAGNLVEEFITLKSSLQKQTEETIENVRRLGFIFALVTLGITILITTRFSQLLVNRINKVEEAIKQMAGGDFSTELDIRSKDEFQDLSQNFNSLKKQLQAKLNSVLNFMVTITSSLEKGPNIEEILSIIAASAAENTDACGAAVYLIDAEEKVLIPRAFSGRYPPPFPLPQEISSSEEKALGFARENRIPIGDHSIGTAVREMRPIFVRSVSALGGGELGFVRPRENPLCIESLIISPLLISHRVLGAIVTVKGPSDGNFTDLDFTHIQTFADYAALTIDNLYNTTELIEKREMQKEISIAMDIQKGLLPRKLPSLPSIKLWAFSRAARGISGDYYDAFLMGKGKIGVVICDVVGKGVPASLLMVMIRTTIRLVPNHQRTPAKLLTFLNRGIVDRVGTEQFATLSLFSYSESSRTVTYANAAHPPLLLYRPKEDAFIEIDTPGLPIGVEKKERYQEKNFSVEIGDVLVFFTDGVTETRSRDGEEYTINGLRHRLRQCGQKSAQEISHSIQEDLENFASGTEQHDDQTLIVMKVES